MKVFWCFFDIFNERFPWISAPLWEFKIKWVPQALTRVNKVFTWAKFITKLFLYFFNERSRSSQQFTTKQINCKQASLLLTKGKSLFYYKLDLYFDGLGFTNFLLNFSFWICTVSCSRKIAATSAVWPQIFLCNIRKDKHFLSC